MTAHMERMKFFVVCLALPSVCFTMCSYEQAVEVTNLCVLLMATASVTNLDVIMLFKIALMGVMKKIVVSFKVAN